MFDKTALETLDVSWLGTPFCDVQARSIPTDSTLDLSHLGVPFVAWGIAGGDDLVDALAGADAMTATVVTASAVTESGTAADAPNATIISNLAETGNPSGVVDGPVAFAGTLNEALAGADVITMAYIAGGALSESRPATDAPSAQILGQGAVVEIGTATEVLTGVGIYQGTLVDVGAGTDALAALNIASGTVSQAMVLTSIVDSAITGALTDDLDADEVVTGLGVQTIEEFYAPTDEPDAIAVMNIDFTETAGVAEVMTASYIERGAFITFSLRPRHTATVTLPTPPKKPRGIKS